MKRQYCLFVVLLSIIISSIQGQVVKRDSKIRLGFGLAGFVSNDVNSLINYFEQSTKEISAGTGISRSQFKKHLFYTIEYEIDLNQIFSYMFTFEIHKDHLSTSDVNYDNFESQHINFDLSYITTGTAFTYYYPFSTTKFGDAKIYVALE